MELNFYMIVMLILLAVGIGIGVLTYYYNRKWVPRQQSKGIAAQPLNRLINNVIKNGYSNKTPLPIKSKGKDILPLSVGRHLNLRNFNLLLNLVTIVLVVIQNENWWTIPVIQTIINIVAYTPNHQSRNKIVKRMAEAAYKKLMWSNNALIAPWRYINVMEWEKNTPIKVRLTLPTEFDATMPATRDSFERQFNAAVSNDNNWSYVWDTGEGHIELTPVALLPERAAYTGSEKNPWNVFSVGVGTDGDVTYDISSHPHVLVGGTTGSGKSVLQRNIIFHCIQHNNMWRFLGVDLKRVELGPFKRYEKTVMGVASELEDGVEIVRYAQRVMNARYSELEEAGVNHFKDLVDPRTGKTKHHALLVMVDEAAMFMGSEGVKTDDGKARDELHGEAVGIIGALARLGRAAGIHLVLATQRPDATFIPGETKANLDVRIAAGRLDSTPSSMILDSGAATLLPGHIKGRGVIRYAGQNQEFQGYFAEASWIDEWLVKNPGVEPTIAEATGVPVLESELSEMEEEVDFDAAVLELEKDATSGTDIEGYASTVEAEFKADMEEDSESLTAKDKKPAKDKKALGGLFKKKEKPKENDSEPEIMFEDEPEPMAKPDPKPTAKPEPELLPEPVAEESEVPLFTPQKATRSTETPPASSAPAVSVPTPQKPAGGLPVPNLAQPSAPTVPGLPAIKAPVAKKLPTLSPLPKLPPKP